MNNIDIRSLRPVDVYSLKPGDIFVERGYGRTLGPFRMDRIEVEENGFRSVVGIHCEKGGECRFGYAEGCSGYEPDLYFVE